MAEQGSDTYSQSQGTWRFVFTNFLPTLSVGDSDPPMIEDHKTRKFGGGAKTPLVQNSE